MLDAAKSTGQVGPGSPVEGPYSSMRAICAVRRPQAAAAARSELCAATIMHSPGDRSRRFAAGGVDARLRLVVAGDLGAENGVPPKPVMRARRAIMPILPFETGASRKRSCSSSSPCPTSGQAGRRCQAVLSWLQRSLAQLRETEARPDPVEIAPVQNVELAECYAARPHLFHCGLILRPPRIGEGDPVEIVARRPEDARSARARSRCASPRPSRRYRRTAPSLLRSWRYPQGQPRLQRRLRAAMARVTSSGVLASSASRKALAARAAGRSRQRVQPSLEASVSRRGRMESGAGDHGRDVEVGDGEGVTQQP
jgi:hypothetical protein